MTDYLVTVTLTVEVRVENADDAEQAADRAAEVVTEEISATESLYMAGVPSVGDVNEAGD